MSVTADQHFAVVPEWVLYADISAQAVRVYACLRRYADKNGKAHPSYKSLADDTRSSVATVKRAISELEAVGAIGKHRRTDGEGRWTSNQYHVISTPAQVAGEPYVQVTDDPYPQVAGEPQTKAIMNQSQKNHKTPAAEAAVESFDAGKWQHLLDKLHDRGYVATGRGALTWKMLMRLRIKYGARVVDSALSDASLSDAAPLGSSSAYFESICVRFAEVFKEAS